MTHSSCPSNKMDAAYQRHRLGREKISPDFVPGCAFFHSVQPPAHSERILPAPSHRWPSRSHAALSPPEGSKARTAAAAATRARDATDSQRQRSSKGSEIPALGRSSNSARSHRTDDHRDHSLSGSKNYRNLLRPAKIHAHCGQRNRTQAATLKGPRSRECE
jgi:hypothetical protein